MKIKQEAGVWKVNNEKGLESAQSFLFLFHWPVNLVLSFVITPIYNGARIPCLTVYQGKELDLVNNWWVFTTIGLHQNPVEYVGEVTVGKHLLQGLLQ